MRVQQPFSIGWDFRFGSGSFGSIFLMILAGLPATTWKSGTSFVTTLPAPIVQPRPMVIPGHTVTLPPNHWETISNLWRYLEFGDSNCYKISISDQCLKEVRTQSSPTVIGAPSSGPLVPFRRKGSSGCVAA